MTLTNIEKAAKLMGYDHAGVKNIDGDLAIIKTKRQVNATWFNPLTNKSDLMDLECALSSLGFLQIDIHNAFVKVTIQPYIVPVSAIKQMSTVPISKQTYVNNKDKFTARAHAVVAVAVQIYDKQFGGE